MINVVIDGSGESGAGSGHVGAQDVDRGVALRR